MEDVVPPVECTAFFNGDQGIGLLNNADGFLLPARISAYFTEVPFGEIETAAAEPDPVRQPAYRAFRNQSGAGS